ncbi:hypothetical protein Sthe_2265 [Sphaerobacter thermophilus DSM 20745]|uniref:Uncharacterized protein n=1 Tax=Sphaerobacter thermophilus (strain ATCC 49802 / DSM 20745 / KCCM 41009 / NCIMB 13125 / S 6022) TaxID=479434 RepID=D1C6R1_SPHTD|nr:hypothetical protein Sthe_2265 [Sphaerobacter thermophilus DSM 20745]
MDKGRETGTGRPPRTGEFVLTAVQACRAVIEAWELRCAAPEPLSDEAEELLWRALRLARDCSADAFANSPASGKM